MGDNRISNDPSEGATRRNILAHSLEWAATLPLAGLALYNFNRQRHYADVDHSQSNLAKDSFDRISTLATLHTEYQQSLDHLEAEFRSAYHKSRTVMVPSVGAKGRVTLRPSTRWYWDEEASVPKHDQVDSWGTDLRSYSKRIDQLATGQFIDVDKLDSLKLVTKDAGAVLQGGLNLVIYGASILGVLRYEEILRLDQNNCTASADGLFNRRSMFKVLAALGGVATAAVVAERIDDRLDLGTANISTQIKESRPFQSIAPDAAYRGYFGSDPSAISQAVALQRERMQQALNTGVENTGVRESMKVAIEHAGYFIEAHQRFFREGIPEALGKRCASAVITEKISSARGQEHMLSESGILLEGLGVGMTMLAVLVPLEALNERIAKAHEAGIRA